MQSPRYRHTMVINSVKVQGHQLLKPDSPQASQGFACISALEAAGIWQAFDQLPAGIHTSAALNAMHFLQWITCHCRNKKHRNMQALLHLLGEARVFCEKYMKLRSCCCDQQR